METYELLYIIPLSLDPRESIMYYTEKIEEKGGQIFKTEIYTGENISPEARINLEGCHILIRYSLDKQYYSYFNKCLHKDVDVIRFIIIKVNDNNNTKKLEEDSAPKCPFCGGDFHIQLCDEEGNPHSVQ